MCPSAIGNTVAGITLSLFYPVLPGHSSVWEVFSQPLSLIESPQLLAELKDVMYRPKFLSILARSGLSPETILKEIRRIAELVSPEALPRPVCRDPDDDDVLALAFAAKADLIVSGDADLLDLQEYQAIPIVTAAKAMKIIESVRSGNKSCLPPLF